MTHGIYGKYDDMVRHMMLRKASLTDEQWVQARLAARFVLAYGDDTTPNPDVADVGKMTYQHMGTAFHTTYSLFPINIACCKLFTNQWDSTIWLEGPNTRSMTDVRGRKVKENYPSNQLPFYEKISDALREIHNGQMEADDVVLAFWQLTYGKMSRSRIHERTFSGDVAAFDRDMLMLKMSDTFKMDIYGL